MNQIEFNKLKKNDFIKNTFGFIYKVIKTSKFGNGKKIIVQNMRSEFRYTLYWTFTDELKNYTKLSKLEKVKLL